MSILRNKLTVYESRNQLLEQEKSDLTETVNMLSAGVKSEPGTNIFKLRLRPLRLGLLKSFNYVK